MVVELPDASATLQAHAPGFTGGDGGAIIGEIRRWVILRVPGDGGVARYRLGRCDFASRQFRLILSIISIGYRTEELSRIISFETTPSLYELARRWPRRSDIETVDSRFGRRRFAAIYIFMTAAPAATRQEARNITNFCPLPAELLATSDALMSSRYGRSDGTGVGGDGADCRFTLRDETFSAAAPAGAPEQRLHVIAGERPPSLLRARLTLMLLPCELRIATLPRLCAMPRCAMNISISMHISMITRYYAGRIFASPLAR